jgi:opacity protein-like surface antigen
MKFKLKNGIFVCAILFSNCVIAGTVAILPSYKAYDGLYLGADISAASLIDNEKTDNPIQDLHDQSALGVIGGGIVGYDFTINNRLKLGIEAFVNDVDINFSDNQNYSPVSSYTVNMDYNVGIRFFPGYEFISGTIGHLILGYSHAKFRINDNGNYGIVDAQFKKSGIQYGLGMTTSVTQNVLIRLDVLYTDYFSETSNGITTTVPTTIQAYHNDLATFEGNLVLIYKFS